MTDMSLKPNALVSQTQKFKIQIHQESSEGSLVGSLVSANDDINSTLSPKSIIKRSQTRKFTLTKALEKIQDLQLQAAKLDTKASSQAQTLNMTPVDQDFLQSIEHKIQIIQKRRSRTQETKQDSIQQNCLVF
ncbi:hypothetical protein SteCoe_8793 [Stentor coeruleus]|uniref:Uncharacterized protein n=1 Tax=Stentor coeruleus TaxID=5963 RepID=A0A1R2CJ61_9CILI|nr:hypothetical protein SteCoe_8793 [Stentor coeruleus]